MIGRIRGLLRAIRREDGGVASIEFAISSMAILTCIVGSIELGRYFYIKNALDYAVGEAGRYAITNPTASDSAISAEVTNNSPSGITPTVSISSTQSGIVTYKTITASGNVAMITKLLPFVTLSTTSRTRVPVM